MSESYLHKADDKKEQLLLKIRAEIYRRLEQQPDLSEESLSELIDEYMLNAETRQLLSVTEKEALHKEVYNALRKLDILQELLEDDTITEIMVNGYKNIFYERAGRIYAWEKQFDSRLRLEDVAQRIAALSNKIVNESVPIVDTRLPDGSRVNIVLPPIALDGPILTIRKFYDTPITIERLIELGSVTEEAANFLQKAVTAKYNIFISGGTGSGKTTFLNALSNFIPKDERIITIEDSAELQIKGVDNLVRLEARNANVEGRNAIAIRDLIKSSLRMRPDRIIVGEVRGSEAIDMIQCMLSGHDGSLSTGHSNGPKDMMARLETMVLMGMDMPVLAIRQQLASAIDLIVHLGRLRDKSRRVLEITEVIGLSDGQIKFNPIYQFCEEGECDNGRVQGRLKWLGNTLYNTEKMAAAAISEYL